MRAQHLQDALARYGDASLVRLFLPNLQKRKLVVQNRSRVSIRTRDRLARRGIETGFDLNAGHFDFFPAFTGVAINRVLRVQRDLFSPPNLEDMQGCNGVAGTTRPLGSIFDGSPSGLRSGICDNPFIEQIHVSAYAATKADGLVATHNVGIISLRSH